MSDIATQLNSSVNPAPAQPELHLGLPQDTATSPPLARTDGKNPVAAKAINPEQGGKEFIDFTNSTPEEIEARFRRVYGNMKQYERTLKDVTDGHQALVEHNKMLDGVVRQMVESSTVAAVGDKTSKLTDEYKEALRNGDVDKAAEINDQLIDLKIQARDVGVGKKPQPQQQTPAFAQPKKLDMTRMDRADVAEVSGWQNEVGQDGELMRPWASEGHPLYQKTLRIAEAVLNDPNLQGGETSAILSEIDSLMGGTKAVERGRPAVLGAGGGSGRGNRSTGLSSEEAEVAQRMGIDPQDYLRQKQFLRRSAS